MLDDPKTYSKYDPENMHELIFNFFEQLPKGRELAETSDYNLIDPSSVERIVVAGMGGSAIGADLLRCYALYRLRVPMYVNRDYKLPAFVDEKTLVILSSYSGNTEETLATLDEARSLGAMLFAISSDGELERKASEWGFGIVRIPQGLPPRAALGYSFAPLLTLFELWGFLPSHEEELNKTTALLHEGAKRLFRDIPEDMNDAKKLARKLHGKLPLIYSTLRLEAVATRFRGQINENAKMLAYSAVIPEMNHNELVGWRYLFKLGDELKPIILLDPEDHPRNRFRANFVADVMRSLSVEPIFLEPPIKDAPFLARMFLLIQLGDFTSYYLAMLNKEDPKPVRVIDKLKAALKEFRE